MTISFVVVGVPVLVPQYRLPTGLAEPDVEVVEDGEVEVVEGGALDVDPHAASNTLVPRSEIVVAITRIGLEIMGNTKPWTQYCWVGIAGSFPTQSSMKITVLSRGSNAADQFVIPPNFVPSLI